MGLSTVTTSSERIKNMKKTIIVLLLAAMLITAVACNTPVDPSGPDDTTPPASDGATTTPIDGSTPIGGEETTPVETTPPEPPEPETPEDMLALFEKVDYNKQAFNILLCNKYNGSISIQQAAEEYNGNVVNDALYERDLALESYFNIDLVYNIAEDNGKVTSIAKTTAEAGLSDYDLIFGGMRASAAQLAVQAYLTDLNSLDAVDLEKLYWNQNIKKDLEIVNKMYFATGDITTRYMSAANLIAFNEQMIKDYGYGNLYQKVYDGTWTIDELGKMIKDKSQDLNQDEKLLVSQDFVAMSGASDAWYGFVVGTGTKALVRNADGIPVVNNTESCYNVIDKLASHLTTPDAQIQDTSYGSSAAFKEERAMFLLSAACDLQIISDWEGYGILPIPKYDTNQEEYYSLANPYISTAVFILRCSKDANKSAAIMEAMAAVSSLTSAPAQYENIMQLRQAKNEDSMKCLKIATEATTFDFTYIYQWGNQLTTIMRKSILDGEAFASTFAATEEPVNAQILKAIAKMR